MKSHLCVTWDRATRPKFVLPCDHHRAIYTKKQKLYVLRMLCKNIIVVISQFIWGCSCLQTRRNILRMNGCAETTPGQNFSATHKRENKSQYFQYTRTHIFDMSFAFCNIILLFLCGVCSPRCVFIIYGA